MISSQDQGRGGNYVWHYTTGDCFKQIAADGFIRAADAHIENGERPGVWFSKRQDFEMTARKGYIEPDGTRRTLTIAETFEKGHGLLRLGLQTDDARLVAWREFRSVSGTPPAIASALARVAQKEGADARDWLVSFEPVPVPDCAVDVMDGLDGPWERVQTPGGAGGGHN